MIYDFKNKKYSIEQLDEYISYDGIYVSVYEWCYMLLYQELTDAFIEKHADKIDWFYISHYQNLTESFIEKYSEWLSWDVISQYQKLSENFIIKYIDKVNWNAIVLYQKLSYEFLEKYLYRYNMSIITISKKGDKILKYYNIYAYDGRGIEENIFHIIKLQEKYPDKYYIDRLECLINSYE